MNTTPVLAELRSAIDPDAQPALEALNEHMGAFYNAGTAGDYFREAHSGNEDWSGKPYHEQIRRAISQGMKVAELGCGSGHSVDNLRQTGASYTGIDWSTSQLAANKKRLGSTPRFVAASLYDIPLSDDSFDVVYSLYVLEHMVWPHRFLDEALRLTRPGGLCIILCPNYRHRHRLPSLRYTERVASLRTKVRQGQILDAAIHAWRRWVAYPYRIARAYPQTRFPFLINLNPSCLAGPYYPDNDAVYFVDRSEIVAWMQQRGSRDVTAHHLPAGTADADTCFLVFQKT